MYKARGLDRDPDALARRLRAMSRVRKLLALAEDQHGRPEGRAAARRADELLARHGLTRAVLEGTDVGQAFLHRSFEVGKKDAWRQTLAAAVAEYFDCVALHRNHATEVELYGPEGALPQVEYTFVVYVRHLQKAWKEHAEALDQSGIWEKLSRRARIEARDAFCVSFTLGVKERLERDRVVEREEDPSTVDETRQQRRALERWMRRGGVRWRASAAGVHTFSNEGFQAGLEAQVDNAVAGRGPRRRLSG